MSIIDIINKSRMTDLGTTVQEFLDAYLETRIQVGTTKLGFFCLIYNN